MSGKVRRALKLILITAQRPNEVIGMQADEINDRWWIIPSKRAKNGKAGELDEVIDAVLNHAKQGVIKVYNLYRYDKEKQAALIKWERRLKLLISDKVPDNIGAKLGAVSLTSCRAQFNQQINAVIPSNEVHTFFCYFACTDMKPTLEALDGGATMPNVNKSKFENLTVILPSLFLCKNFHEFCYPVFRQIQVLALQNQKLRAARDLLLPKLMSGEIAV